MISIIDIFQSVLTFQKLIEERESVLVVSKRVIERCLMTDNASCFITEASNGVKLELRKDAKPGLLAEVTRTFRENALNITRAEISTIMGKAENIFYITDTHGNHVDSKVVESVQQRIGLDYLKVKELPLAFRNHEKAENMKGGAVFWRPIKKEPM